MATVTFKADVSPYMTGDVVELTDAEKKRVDEEAKRRNLKDAYVSADKKPATKETNTKAKAKSSK